MPDLICIYFNICCKSSLSTYIYIVPAWCCLIYAVNSTGVFRFGCVFSKMYFPPRADKRTPKIVKSQNVRILSIFIWFHPFPFANSMQNTSPMHLNTSPTCFEGSGTGKHENRHKSLKDLKLAPKKQLGVNLSSHRRPRLQGTGPQRATPKNFSALQALAQDCLQPLTKLNASLPAWKVVNGV